MIKSQDLINKICAKIDCGGLTELETCQTTGALNLLDTPVYSVATCANLPNAVDYAGRLIYVNDENRYYHAVDGFWFNNLDTVPFNYKDTAWDLLVSPTLVTGGITDWCQVSISRFHRLGIRSDGTAWTWGCNNVGQLGDGTTTNRTSPVSVVGGFTDWCQIIGAVGRVTSGEDAHSLGLRQTGSLWTWGCNGQGRLGDGTTTNRSSPVSVVGGFTDWCQADAGGANNIAVRCNGTAWAWGNNYCGRLGDGTVTSRTSPVSVVGGFTDWCQVSFGASHTIGLRTNGTIWSWGAGDGGRLGNNDTANSSSPVSVVGGFTDWCQISAGGLHSLALRCNGTAWSWGNNGSAVAGVLGDGTTTARSSPVSVVGGFTDWCQIAGGGSHSHGIRTNGTLWGWGFSVIGDGQDNNVIRNSPVSVLGGYSEWCQVSGGVSSSIAIRQQCKGF